MKEATARGENLPVAWKSAVMVGRFVKGKALAKAKRLMEEVIAKKTAVPFPKFNKDRGHKRGNMAAGRYPVKAAVEVLNLLKSAEKNAENLGMSSSSLFVSRYISNQGPTSWRFGRKRRRQTKRSHIQVFVAEKPSETKKEKAGKGVAKK
jgi:large subunit ribosomal protein L22